MSERLKNLGGSITSAYGVVETSIRKHFWYILVILLVAFLLAMAKGSDADRLSLTSSVLSIALAVIVVILSIVHSCDMKNLVDKANEAMKETISEFGHSLESTIEGLGGRHGNATLANITEIKEGEIDKLNLTNCLFATLAFLYVIARSDKSKKPFKCSKVADIVFYYDPKIKPSGISTYFFGIMNALEISWQQNIFELRPDGHHVKKLPDSFMERVEKEMVRRIEEPPIEPIIKERFQHIKKEIDEYWTFLQKK